MTKPKDKTVSTQVSSQQEITQFIDQINKLPVTASEKPGRIIFAIDATASRQPTWDTACQIQSSMFTQTQKLGGILTQLCYYRGFHEFQYSPWHRQSQTLMRDMQSVNCLGGHTQIGRLLQHTLDESRRHKVNALVFIGDAVEEAADRLCDLAGQLGLVGVPIFIFHEGGNPSVGSIFKQLATLSQGAYCPFDRHSQRRLEELLGAVAVYASGGMTALLNLAEKSPEAVKLLTQQIAK
ncbi:VWA domain-containing protein [Aurantivibrio plasticivorans]